MKDSFSEYLKKRYSTDTWICPNCQNTCSCHDTACELCGYDEAELEA